MFTPVSAHKFYDTVPGNQFLELATKAPQDPYDLFSPDEVEANQSQARLDVCAQWLTGNYDPGTNMHTLYRGVDDAMLKDFEEHDALTSRIVRIFGDYDPVLAEKTLRKAARGKVLKHLRNNTEELLAESEATIIRKGYVANTSLDATKDMLRGKPSDAVKELLSSKAELLQTVRGGGRLAYLAAVQEAGKDDVPPILTATMYGLTHSSIHFTTDPEFIKARQKSSWFSHVLKVQFIPGALALAPQTGHIDGQFLPPQGSNGLYEREWYGIGQLKPKPGTMSITRLP